jgi:hypothetical protein
MPGMYNHPMRDLALLLSILAVKVYSAKLPSGAHLRDVGDVSEWLQALSQRAEHVATMEQLFEETQ